MHGSTLDMLLNETVSAWRGVAYGISCGYGMPHGCLLVRGGPYTDALASRTVPLSFGETEAPVKLQFVVRVICRE